MPHPDDSFWLSVFRKSPVIGLCMAVFGLIGCVIGIFSFLQLAPFLRVYLCAISGCTFAGIFVGLIIGVALDSMFGPLFRSDKKKKRSRNIWRD
jgi:hypothetical protein